MKKIIKKIIVGFIVSLSYISIPFDVTFAGQSDGFSAGEFKNPIGANSIEELIAVILEFVVKVGTIIAVFAIIYSGFLFVKSQGNESEITKAKTVFFWTIIGALILVGAQVIANVICSTATELGAGSVC